MQQTTQDRKSNPRKHTGFTTVELFMAQEAFAYYMQIHPDSRTKSNPYKMLQKLMQQKNGLKGSQADIQFKWRKLYRGSVKWRNAILKGVRVDIPSWGGGRLGCLKRVISYLKSLNRTSYASCHIYRMLRATAWGYGWEFKAEPRKRRVDSDKLEARFRRSMWKQLKYGVNKKIPHAVSNPRNIKIPSTVKIVSGFSLSRYGVLRSMPHLEIRKVGRLLVGESRVQKCVPLTLPKKIRRVGTTEKITQVQYASPLTIDVPKKSKYPGVTIGSWGTMDVSKVRLEDYPQGSFDPDSLPSSILDRLMELHHQKYGT